MSDFHITPEDIIIPKNSSSQAWFIEQYPDLDSTQIIRRKQSTKEVRNGFVIPPEDKESMVLSIERNGMRILYTL